MDDTLCDDYDAGYGNACRRSDEYAQDEAEHPVITDRMAHELGLSPRQYDDVYEVNYDFISNVRYLMDDVVRGHGYALDRYYDFLDVRNDDLRWILSRAQYRRFMAAEHFYRPIYAQSDRWHFRIYLVYKNVDFFYFGKPHHYTSYCGGHYRTHHNNVSYYKTHHHKHYRHDVYDGHYRIRHDRSAYDDCRRRDFNVASRPSGHEAVIRLSVRPVPTRAAENVATTARGKTAAQGRTTRAWREAAVWKRNVTWKRNAARKSVPPRKGVK